MSDLSDKPRYFTRSWRYTTDPERADRTKPQPLTERELEDSVLKPARDRADAANRDVEQTYAAKVRALEHQLAAVIAYGREHKFVSYRQADNARRAVRALHRSDAPMP